MAKCMVSGLGVGGGDGWVLMDEWDAVQSTPFGESGICFYGSLVNIAFVGYTMLKIEVSGNIIGNNNNASNTKVCTVSAYPCGCFHANAPGNSKNYTMSIEFSYNSFLSTNLSKEGYYNFEVFPETYNNPYETFPNKIDGVALRMGTEYNISFVSANLHVKVYAKK